MRMHTSMSLTLVAVGFLLFASASSALRAADKDAPCVPKRFAIIFNRGYGGDFLPAEPAAFEKVIRGIREARFNTVLCKYEDWRARICKKYGVQIFVDLLAPGHHVYKEADSARKLCESLRGNDVVYGYHLWSDIIGETYAGRSRDAKNVREWDPTHPVYVGTYRMSRVDRVENLDLFGYYDFNWTRGGHWEHLRRAWDVAKAKHIPFLRYCEATPGRVGVGNDNRIGYTVGTSLVFGLKGYLFHYAGGVVDEKTGALDALGKDLLAVNTRFEAVGAELLALGIPTAVYSTTITKDEKDHAVEGAPAVPGGLTPIPADSAFQVAEGEVLLGVFKGPKDADVLAMAGHNPYAPQTVTLKFASPVKVSAFDGARKAWTPQKSVADKVSFKLEEYTVALVRIER
jgi:hypothetical protein